MRQIYCNRVHRIQVRQFSIRVLRGTCPFPSLPIAYFFALKLCIRVTVICTCTCRLCKIRVELKKALLPNTNTGERYNGDCYIKISPLFVLLKTPLFRLDVSQVSPLERIMDFFHTICRADIISFPMLIASSYAI